MAAAKAGAASSSSLGFALDGPGVALNGTGSALDGTGSALDGTGSALDGTGSALAGPRPALDVIDLTGEEDGPCRPDRTKPTVARSACWIAKQKSRKRHKFQTLNQRRYRLKKLKNGTEMRQQAQSLHYNRSGMARTRDHEMVTIVKRPAGACYLPIRGFAGYVVPKPRKGSGGAKVWTGPAICGASFAPPQQPSRTASKAEGASHGHVRGCGMLTADMIEIGYNEYGKRLREESLEEPLKFYITNNMFDETKLYIARDGGRAKKRRTVAQACQIAYQKPARLGGLLPIHDKDIVRPPALVQQCTAAA